ncbi:hypothetical protein NA56DRAFT_649890 [Hyaloscypha hepaticicola]|uniref:CFEM domain-containing protein n=1 Tax=Hyaloscypha hepaticicola TaxID=2082293 RepID=A0A2J6PPB7_9HELO|nr:hypothetical protein NA56DRAFT_649890 [Hyaloscypha hepaticicola]
MKQSCLAEYTSGNLIAGCSSLDVACICSNPGFISEFSCCIYSGCSAADQQTAIAYATQLCASNGVTNLPTSAGCTSTVSSASSIIASATGGSVTSSGISSATTTQLSSGASSSPATSFSTSPNSGLSTGAKAGIAVGAIAGAIIVVLALFLLLRKRKIHEPQVPAGNMQLRYDIPREAEFPAEKPTGTVQGRELETPANKHELESPKKEKTIQRGGLATGANDHELWRIGSHSPETFTTVIGKRSSVRC